METNWTWSKGTIGHSSTVHFLLEGAQICGSGVHSHGNYGRTIPRASKHEVTCKKCLKFKTEHPCAFLTASDLWEGAQ
jgi:hypothetical protein